MADAADVVLTLTAREGQYHIHSSSGINNAWPGTNDGLFVGDDSWVAVLCGTQWGPITLNVRHHEVKPVSVEQGWDMVAEWSMNCSRGRLTVQSLYGDEPEIFVPVSSEWVRLRVSVRNRMSGAEIQEPVAEAVEEHHLQYWPTPERESPAVLHGPDDFGTLYLQSM